MRVDAVPDRIVVDASLGLKWVMREDDSDLATALGRGRELLTSALFWAEAANALATRVRRGELSRAQGNDALRDLQATPLKTRALDAESVASALALAHDLRHPVYDCCYLALAVAEDSLVITADGRFHATVRLHPGLRERVVLLRDLDAGV